MDNFLTFILAAWLLVSCSYQGTTEQEICPCADTLTDESTDIKFYLDSTRTNIYAFRSKELIWRTNPRIDNNLEFYRFANPTIDFFGLTKPTDDIEYLGISYTNSQFGRLNKETGEFTFLGQD